MLTTRSQSKSLLGSYDDDNDSDIGLSTYTLDLLLKVHSYLWGSRELLPHFSMPSTFIRTRQYLQSIELEFYIY